MPAILGNLIVIAVLCGAVALIVRSMWKNRKKSGCAGCSGGCAGCSGGCGHSTGEKRIL